MYDAEYCTFFFHERLFFYNCVDVQYSANTTHKMVWSMISCDMYISFITGENMNTFFMYLIS